MKNSRTSTNSKTVKRVNSNRNVSTSPSSTNTKKVVKGNKPNNKGKKNNITINNKKVVKKNLKSQPKVQRNTIKRNTHSIDNNVRLNKVIDDIEYVPFFEDNQDIQTITPNTIRKVEPERIYNEPLKGKNKRKVKPITIIKVTLFIAIVSVIGYLMLTLETFNLTNIKVKNNEKYSEEDIIQKSNLNIGENVFKQLLLNGKNKINLSYISKASFGYSFPSTIVITVEERYPAYIAIDKNTEKIYKIDNEGYLLEECNLSQKKDEIIIEGMVFEENVELGKKINEVYIKKIDIYNNIKELVEKYDIGGNITKVTFSNSLTIISLDDKLKIVFSNDSNLEYKVSFLKGIIKKNGGIVEGIIDMSIENPVYSKYD